MTRPSEASRARSADALRSLQEAADRLHEQLLDRLPPETEPACLRREIDAVVEAVRRAMDGGDAALTEFGELDRVQLLRHLRSHMLDSWTAPDGTLLPLMRALDAVERSAKDQYAGAAVADALSPFSRNLLREVAHLLRSPLGSIVAIADTLDDPDGSRPPAERRRVGIIRKAALSASMITSDLLTLLNDEQRTEGAEQFRVFQTLDSVTTVVRPVAEARGCELTITCADDRLRSGPARGLAQTLLTVLVRAALMTRDSALTVQVTADPDDRVSFDVVSEGNDLAGTLDRDESGAFLLLAVDTHARTLSMSSDGLGLEAARRLLHAMGSDLDVRRIPPGDFGLSFGLTLPAVD